MLVAKSKKRKRNKWAAALMAAIITVTTVSLPENKVAAAIANGPKDAKEVEAFADAYFNRPEVKKSLAGGAFVVVGEDKVLLNKGFGYADVKSKKLIDPNETLFRVASVSKVFTATALMQLVEEGKVDLNGDIHNYTSGFKVANKTTTKLKIQDLLTHTSGFDYSDIDLAGPSTLEQYIENYAPTVVRKPGTAYKYDNYASNLQGYIVQKMTNKPFEEVVEDKIFRPLGMTNSDFRITDKVKEKLATGHNGNGEAMPFYEINPPIMPTGGMVATSTDISKFMLAHLNGGQLGNQRILQEKTVKEMHQTRISIHPELPTMSYGFEMFHRENYNGENVIGKAGDLSGFHSWMWLLPDRKVGGFIVLNGDKDNTAIISGLFKAFMDHYYPETDKERPVLALTKAQLTKYEGSYRFLRYPLAHFAVRAEEGYLSFSGATGNKKLVPIGDGLFRDESGKAAAFKGNEEGKITHLDYSIPSAWSERVEDKRDYDDVPRNHPYANEIYTLRTLDGALNPDAVAFEPERALTRAEFATQLHHLMNYPLTQVATTFADTEGHRYSTEINQLAVIGIIKGNATGQFYPDRIITREEAAVMVYRSMQTFGALAIPVKLSGETAIWGQEAVQFLVATGMAGPEIEPSESGADFRSKDELLHKESAFILSNIARVLVAAMGF
ncbi:serine hydrolase [Paenibacillus sp. L3-i20]|uniref:serine hydrolase n=1 Tax=Paenibacillus sp. L3-i20 TaxID=2905833 RepID=UPI001EDE038A|nr:serine hydrolase [Paenibacillus sp. L3-i20]GKU76551.1 hypothetical protein L3i20_v209480 [Paenibacillus sp. L3-i20]